MTASIACIPDWRGDETLYSWVAGFHAIYGNGSARDTGMQLFGAGHACRERDSQSNLHHFVSATRGKLGDVSSILHTRTSIGLFAPFLPTPRQKLLVDRITSGVGSGWRLLCGLPASCLGDPSALRYCVTCVANDVSTWGWPRWRLPHQLLGAWICLDHGLLLKTMNSKASQWLLPPIEPECDNTSPSDRAQADGLRRVASLALSIVGTTKLDITTIRQAVFVGLMDQSISSWSHPLDKSILASWFAQQPLANWIRSSNGPWQRLASGTWLHDLLRNRVGDHPLKWMLLWCALFSGESELSSIRRFIDPESAPHWDAYGQGTIWGTTSAEVPSDIQRIIAESQTLKDAANTLGISVFSLRRRLSELGTNGREFRLSTSYGKRKLRALEAISDFVKEHPSCSRSDIHRDCKAAVAWIRSNDPDLMSLALESIADQKSRQLQLI